MDVIKINDTEELGVIVIPEKSMPIGSYSFNHVIIFDDNGNARNIMLSDDRFSKIGEIELEDD